MRCRRSVWCTASTTRTQTGRRHTEAESRTVSASVAAETEQRPKTSAEVDYNGFFVKTNYLLFAGTMAFYAWAGFPSLVNGVTLILYGLLVAQVRVFLAFEKR